MEELNDWGILSSIATSVAEPFLFSAFPTAALAKPRLPWATVITPHPCLKQKNAYCERRSLRDTKIAHFGAEIGSSSSKTTMNFSASTNQRGKKMIDPPLEK
jgi:hypothetical protein